MTAPRPAPAAKPQPGILDGLPNLGRYLCFTLDKANALRPALERLCGLVDGNAAVVGLGPVLVQRLGQPVPGLRPFPRLPVRKTAQVPGLPLPADRTALWCWLRSAEGEDTGHLLRRSQQLQQALAPAFALQQVVDGFCHARVSGGASHDLSSYEDGTENPKGRAARSAALVTGQGPGLDGGSFVAVQQWAHDFEALRTLSRPAQDDAVGRRQSDNEELEDAPASAHVKRTAQESFDPEAFVVRRSMPWAQGMQAGLMFVAFGRTLDAFEAQWRRMAGLEDGIVDGIFRMSRPLTGGYYWCPPMAGKRLDLRHLGIATPGTGMKP